MSSPKKKKGENAKESPIKKVIAWAAAVLLTIILILVLDLVPWGSPFDFQLYGGWDGVVLETNDKYGFTVYGEMDYISVPSFKTSLRISRMIIPGKASPSGRLDDCEFIPNDGPVSNYFNVVFAKEIRNRLEFGIEPSSVQRVQFELLPEGVPERGRLAVNIPPGRTTFSMLTTPEFDLEVQNATQTCRTKYGKRIGGLNPETVKIRSQSYAMSGVSEDARGYKMMIRYKPIGRTEKLVSDGPAEVDVQIKFSDASVFSAFDVSKMMRGFINIHNQSRLEYGEREIAHRLEIHGQVSIRELKIVSSIFLLSGEGVSNQIYVDGSNKTTLLKWIRDKLPGFPK